MTYLTNEQFSAAFGPEEQLTQYLTMVGPSSGAGADATAIINQFLSTYGLQDLQQWAWAQITDGASATQLQVAIEATPQFDTRFPAIAMLRKAGLPAISPSEYLTYESNAKQLESNFGLPTGYLTDPHRIASFISGGVSTSELTDRIQKGYAEVAYAPPATRQSFTAMFGVNGDGALAAHFLDPKAAAPLLEQQATAADIAGRAGTQGIDINRSLAETMAASNITGDVAQSGLGNLAKRQQLYDQSVSEQPGMTIGDTGVKSEFGLSPDAQGAEIARQQQRAAAFKGGGGPASDQFGVEGAGTTRSF